MRILRNRGVLSVLIILITLIMGWFAKDTHMSYNSYKVVPENNPKYIDYMAFRHNFGEDGNTLVIGVKSFDFFHIDFFTAWYELGNEIKKIKGISGVLSIPTAYNISRNDSLKSFETVRIMNRLPKTQAELDSFKKVFLSLPFYEGLLYNTKTHTTLMAVSLKQKELDSKARIGIVNNIQELGEKFANRFNTELHYSGMPFIRSFLAYQLKRELLLFIFYALLILTLILLLLFRNVYAVIFPVLVVIVGAVWSLGILNMFGYKVTLLTGLIPTLIVVIGIPNCVYLINKYHIEFKKHGKRQRALLRATEKIGNATFFTNLTTAIGFGVFTFTKVRMLTEFGIVTFLSISAIFLLTMVGIPILFSYLPDPKQSHVRHLERKFFIKWLDTFEKWTVKYQIVIFVISGLLVIIAAFGATKLKSRGYILDDVPHQVKVYRDLKFFEHEFNGALPFNVLIDTKVPKGALNYKFVKKLQQAQDSIASIGLFSRPLSIVEAFKLANQAYHSGLPSRYRLPTRLEISSDPNLRTYIKHAMVDTTVDVKYVSDSGNIARISLQIPDIGSDSMPKVLAVLKPKIDHIFSPDKYRVVYTGTSLIALEGYNYLVHGLIQSVIIALVLISLIMFYLFRSFRMLLFSLIPNLIPLIATAGIMGYSGINLKPSTVLIFSIAFGISVDYTIHFLAKYRQELYRHNWDIGKTVKISLHETGISMIYTSLILMCGFFVFTFSTFDSTANLGKLTTITFAIALLCNLILLPAMLLRFEKMVMRKAIKSEALIDIFNEDDEDVDEDKLKIKHGKFK